MYLISVLKIFLLLIAKYVRHIFLHTYINKAPIQISSLSLIYHMRHTSKQVYEYISQKKSDPIHERKICSRTWKEFPIFSSEQKLLESYAPIINWTAYHLSSPDQSPEARNIHRMLFRNDRVFYKWKSDHSWKWVISLYPPWSKATVYETNERYKDFRDPKLFALDRVPWESIKSKILQVTHAVPRMNVDWLGSTNSDFCNYCWYCKDCYMDIAWENNQSCYFCLFTKYAEYCVDCSFAYNSQRCYECISIYDTNKSIYSEYLENCFECSFSFDLKNCSNCLFCWNLRNQSYCILNKQVSKEEYIKTYNSIINWSWKSFTWAKDQFEWLRTHFVVPWLTRSQTEYAYGNNLKNIKNWIFCFNAKECEDSSYLYDVLDAKNCLDLNYSLYHPESSYQLMSTLDLKQSICNVATHHSHHVYYCQLCNNSQHLFWCVWLNNKEYCIFNKQYTKKTYFDTLEKILQQRIAIWKRGTFFDTSLCLHPYNDTVAQEYFPIKSLTIKWTDTCIDKNWYGNVTIQDRSLLLSDATLDLWWSKKIDILRRNKKEDPRVPENNSTISIDQLPDTIHDVETSDLSSKIIVHSKKKKPFRLIWAEIEFYKKMNLPLPRFHPDTRHNKRSERRPQRSLILTLWNASWVSILSTLWKRERYTTVSQSEYEKIIY